MNRLHHLKILKSQKKEISFFKNLNVLTENRIKELPAISQKKVAAMLKAKNRISGTYSESCFGDHLKKVQLGPFQFQYGYQRINLRSLNPFKSQPYTSLILNPDKYSAYFTFTSCGQSALSVSIFTVLKMYGCKTLDLYEHVYYETFLFFKEFGISTRSLKNLNSKIYDPRGRVLLLDSTTFPNEGKIPRHYACVIIDTTCWSLGDPILKKIVNQLLYYNTDVVLARSHIKLDCLGTEWNRLGSVLYLTRSRKKKKSTQFDDLFKEKSNPLGAKAEIRQVYPFLKSKIFHRLNEQWVRRIKTTNQLIQETVQQFAKQFIHSNSTLIELQTFPHSLFFYIVTRESDYEPNETRVKRLIRVLRKHDLASSQITSYPWDFFSFVTFLKADQDGSKKENSTIRISCPGLSPNDAQKAIKLIQHWMIKEFT